MQRRDVLLRGLGKQKSEVWIQDKSTLPRCDLLNNMVVCELQSRDISVMRICKPIAFSSLFCNRKKSITVDRILLLYMDVSHFKFWKITWLVYKYWCLLLGLIILMYIKFWFKLFSYRFAAGHVPTFSFWNLTVHTN